MIKTKLDLKQVENMWVSVLYTGLIICVLSDLKQFIRVDFEKAEKKGINVAYFLFDLFYNFCIPKNREFCMIIFLDFIEEIDKYPRFPKQEIMTLAGICYRFEENFSSKRISKINKKTYMNAIKKLFKNSFDKSIETFYLTKFLKYVNLLVLSL